MRNIAFAMVLLFALSTAAACSHVSLLDGKWTTGRNGDTIGWLIIEGSKVSIYSASPNGEVGELRGQTRWEKDGDSGKINIFETRGKGIWHSCTLTTPDELDCSSGGGIPLWKRVSK